MIGEKLQFKFSLTVEAESLIDAEMMMEEIIIGQYESNGTIAEVFESEEVKDGSKSKQTKV